MSIYEYSVLNPKGEEVSLRQFEGKVLLHGDSESIAKDPIARKYYLGENFRM